MSKNEKIVWIDVETTGISPDDSKLLQTACIITDSDFNEIGPGFEEKIYYSEDEVKSLLSITDPYVVNMHEKTGLWSALSTDGVALAESEQNLYDYIVQYVPESRSARLGGNSITLDRNFLAVYMPKVLNHVHYRSYDMSSIHGFFDLFAPKVPSFQKKLAHDALSDIRESIAEARHYAHFMKQTDYK